MIKCVRSFGTEIDHRSSTTRTRGSFKLRADSAGAIGRAKDGATDSSLVVRRCRLVVGEAINTRARAHGRAHPSSLHSSSEAFCKIGCETRRRIGLRSAPACRRPLCCRRELEVSAKPLRCSRIQLRDQLARRRPRCHVIGQHLGVWSIDDWTTRTIVDWQRCGIPSAPRARHVALSLRPRSNRTE